MPANFSVEKPINRIEIPEDDPQDMTKTTVAAGVLPSNSLRIA